MTIVRQTEHPVEVHDTGLPQNNWSTPGRAAYDFRSDFVTSPNMSMLESIVNTTLLDDEMMEDPTTNYFQEWMAQLTGHERALLTYSGTMSNQVALRTALTTPPYSILADHRSHILNMEAGGAATVCGALIHGVIPANGHHLTLEDIKKHFVFKKDIYDCPTRVISLENTLFGTIMPLDEIRDISMWAKTQDPPVHMHLDGARLWEAVAAGAGALSEFCACFDSVSLCFTKGLGAPIGSVIVGNTEFITRARWMRKLLGGGLRQTGIISAPMCVALEEVFLGGKLKRCQERAKYISTMWERLGGSLLRPTETNMMWMNLNDGNVDKKAFQKVAKELGLKVHEKERLEGRLVVHYQISDDAIKKLEIAMRAALSC
ncbi:hypothetical protein CBS63078_1593 [Aspergillus niger]|uniref:Threonine aldolase n=2 Tax=Aspergillus niger TaxID=5061 RepID=G3Y2E0_ASPNA|nr:threonine aldolase [Aspergillus niger ATCC 1015]KAI2864395.1 hypothetical protein CBS12448_2888 [Aspergillus niger]KAI2901460.1 hypothetical protein CBS13152_1766 [Aspergillus niger]KAI2925751.1 hypothetical protein CBS147371_122 [Aspergillus niger]KAI2931267.1 hypothetical protein CBS63078_1593 [Aspergillus niger]